MAFSAYLLICRILMPNLKIGFSVDSGIRRINRKMSKISENISIF